MFIFLIDDTVVLEVNRFDPGKWVESERLIPNALLPDDIPIRCKVIIYSFIFIYIIQVLLFILYFNKL